MRSVKQIVHELADKLPEQATFDDAMYALYVRQKLEKGLLDLDEGRTYTQEEVEQRLLGKRPA
jgi:predicted transcriptional regulator